MTEETAPAEREFDSGEGAFHIFKSARDHGWGGLIYLLTVYVIVSMVLYGVLFWGLAPIFSQLPDLVTVEPDPSEVMGILSRLWVAMPLFLLLFWVFYSIMDAALLRWCYGRGARIRFGGIELRLMVIGLLWYVLGFVIWIPTTVLIGLGAGISNIWLILFGSLSVFITLGAWIWLAVKFAPAAALTVYRGHFSVFRGWSASKGFFWGLLGAFAILWVIYLALSIALSILGQALQMMVLGDAARVMTNPFPGDMTPEESAALLQTMFSGEMLVVMAVQAVLSTFVYFFFQAAMAGTNAYAVKFGAAGEAPDGPEPLSVTPPPAPSRVEAASPEQADAGPTPPGPAGAASDPGPKS